MKIQFDASLDFQQEGISSVTGIFEGQETCQTNFTVAPLDQKNISAGQASYFENDLGIGNRLKLLDDDILENIISIQLRNGLTPSESPKAAKKLDLNFTVEMETGTGVLSLFFIDRVANYRWYDEGSTPQKGKFATMFEEEYQRAIQKPKYRSLLSGTDPHVEVGKVHNGKYQCLRRKRFPSTGSNHLLAE